VAGIEIFAVPPELTPVAFVPTCFDSQKIEMSAGTLLLFCTVIVQGLSATAAPAPINVVIPTSPANLAFLRNELNIGHPSHEYTA
jgi:hypothetical protein